MLVGIYVKVLPQRALGLSFTQLFNESSKNEKIVYANNPRIYTRINEFSVLSLYQLFQGHPSQEIFSSTSPPLLYSCSQIRGRLPILISSLRALW